MKICFVSTYAYPLFDESSRASFGGAEVQMFLLAQELARDNEFMVHFVTAKFKKKKLEKINNISVYQSFSLRQSHKTTNVFRKLIQVGESLKLLVTLLKINADVYIQRNAGAETGITALACRIMNKKFIYMTSHDIDCSGKYYQHSKYKSLLRNRTRRLFSVRGRLFRYGIRKAHLVLVQSKQHQDMILKNIGIQAGILNTAYHIQNLSKTQREYILWVARIVEWKRPKLFLMLAEMLPSEKFLMIGPPGHSQSFYNDFREQIQSCKNVRYIPSCPFSEIENYFIKAKVFISTSRIEGFPNTFIQACKNGVPILSINVNPDNIFNKYRIGICTKTLEEMKDQLLRLLNDQKLYYSYVQNCYTYALENHNMNAIIIQFKKYIHSLNT